MKTLYPVIWEGKKGAVGGSVNETRCPWVEGENDTNNRREKERETTHSVKLMRVRSPLAAASARAPKSKYNGRLGAGGVRREEERGEEREASGRLGVVWFQGLFLSP